MKEITENVRGYEDDSARLRAIGALQRLGWNHFTCFKDVKAEFALKFEKAAWVPQGEAHIIW